MTGPADTTPTPSVLERLAAVAGELRALYDALPSNGFIREDVERALLIVGRYAEALDRSKGDES